MSTGRQSGYRLREDIDSAKVDGPAVATDGAIAVFDGTTGKVIADSGVTVAELEASISASMTQAQVLTRVSFRG